MVSYGVSRGPGQGQLTGCSGCPEGNIPPLDGTMLVETEKSLVRVKVYRQLTKTNMFDLYEGACSHGNEKSETPAVRKRNAVAGECERAAQAK